MHWCSGYGVKLISPPLHGIGMLNGRTHTCVHLYEKILFFKCTTNWKTGITFAQQMQVSFCFHIWTFLHYISMIIKCTWTKNIALFPLFTLRCLIINLDNLLQPPWTCTVSINEDHTIICKLNNMCKIHNKLLQRHTPLSTKLVL
jgi:hypothetical protein